MRRMLPSPAPSATPCQNWPSRALLSPLPLQNNHALGRGQRLSLAHSMPNCCAGISCPSASTAGLVSPGTCRHHSRPVARPSAAGLAYGVPLTVPEPVPEASSLPEDPPVRSELIDLTRAIKRCCTWQQLRALYWTNRTRQGAVNVVSFITRLAALVPDLPALLQEPDDAKPDLEALLQPHPGPQARQGPIAPRFQEPRPGLGPELRASFAYRQADGQGNYIAGADGDVASGEPRTAVRGRRPVTGAASANRVATSVAAATGAAQPQRLWSGGDGDGATGPSTAEPLSAAERAALRQVVIRMMYDAGSFTREQVAAGRLDQVLKDGVTPWNTGAFLSYMRGYDGIRGSGPGEGARRSQVKPPAAQHQQQRPLSFWDWLRGHPEAWTDPVASQVTFGLQHWDAVPLPPAQEPHGGNDAFAAPGPGAKASSGSSAAAVAATAAGAAAGRAVAQRVRKVPQCFGPLELATLAWAAARLQLHRAVPEHAAWLLQDLLYGSYQQMTYFDGRQLAQLSYSLAQLGPCVPPARWRRRFLSSARRRMAQMDSQSLANLAFSLEPLHLQPDPAWLRDLLAASGHMMERQEPTAAELTQLSWAVFSGRRRLYQPRRWAAEVLDVAAGVLDKKLHAIPTSTPAPLSTPAQSTSYPSPAVTLLPSAPVSPSPSAFGTSSSSTYVACVRRPSTRPYWPRRWAAEMLAVVAGDQGTRTPATPTLPFIPAPSSPFPSPATLFPPSTTSTPAPSSPSATSPPPSRPPPPISTPQALGASDTNRLQAVRVLHELPPLLHALGAPLTPGQLEELRRMLLQPSPSQPAKARVPDGAPGTSPGDIGPSPTAAVRAISPPYGPCEEHGNFYQVKGHAAADDWRPASRHATPATAPTFAGLTSAQGAPAALASQTGVGVGAGVVTQMDPWVSPREAHGLLTSVAAGPPPYSALAVWLLRQPPTVLLVMRTSAAAWAAGGGGARGGQGRCSLEKQQLQRDGEEGNDKDEGEQDEGGAARFAARHTRTRAALKTASYLTRYFSAAAATSPPPAPPPQPLAPALGSIRRSETGGPPGLLTMALDPALEPLPPDSLLLTLHTACWPSERWLEALAAAASSRLHSPTFRAQSLGIILWSLAGLGYRPRPGWLQPWLDRVSELWLDFRPPNLVSVLCALSAWGELPIGHPAAMLRAAAVRVVPYMGARELELAASALAQLCELPPPAAAGPDDTQAHGGVRAAAEDGVRAAVEEGHSAVVTGFGARGRPALGADGGSGGRSGRSRRTGRGPGPKASRDRSSSRGDGGQRWRDEVELFAPLPGSASAAAGTLGSATPGPVPHVADRRGPGSLSGGVAAAANRDFSSNTARSADGQGGMVGAGQCRQGCKSRHRDLEPWVARLLVGRVVQVSPSYSPHHMARVLRLLVERLGCPVDLSTLGEMLERNAAHLEGIAARARRRNQARLRRRRPRTADGWEGSSGSGGAEAGREGRQRRDFVKRRDMQELAAAALDAARVVSGQGGGSMSDESAAALLPARWWRAYLAVLNALG